MKLKKFFYKFFETKDALDIFMIHLKILYFFIMLDLFVNGNKINNINETELF